MKISATQYARSLYDLTAGKTEKEVDGVVAGFLKVVIKNRHLKLVKKIMAKFSEISNEEQGIVEAEVTTRSKIQDTMTKQIEKFVKEKYQAKKVVIKNKIDEKIKGGIVIKVGDEVMDGSVARQLAELRSSLEK